jgi:hypothetical protein
MGEVLTWGAVIAAAASILGWVNHWMAAGADRQRITNVEALATATMAKAEILSSNLAEFKIEAALVSRWSLSHHHPAKET